VTQVRQSLRERGKLRKTGERKIHFAIETCKRIEPRGQRSRRKKEDTWRDKTGSPWKEKRRGGRQKERELSISETPAERKEKSLERDQKAAFIKMLYPDHAAFNR